MSRSLALVCVIALAACSQEPAASEGAEDFAARVGTSGAPAAAEPAANTAQAGTSTLPETDVTQLEKLGNIATVDLGPRAGGCTFSSDGTEMLIAAGADDRSLPGKATVRVDGDLIVLDAPPGGFDLVKSGTTFNGNGFSVLVSPREDGAATMTVTDAEGRQRQFDGRYVCS